MKKFPLLLITMFAPLMLAGQVNTQWRGDNRDGIYNETGLLKQWPETGPGLLWHYDELGDGHTSASVTADRIFTSGMKDSTGYVFAFDLNGKLIWQKSYGPEWTESWPGVRTTPVLNDGKLYLMSGFGKIVCMDPASGKIIWQTDLMKEYGAPNITWAFTENLLIEGNMLFCTPGGPEHNVMALDKNTGKRIWSAMGKGEKSAYGSPILIRLPKLKILVVMTERSILGLDASNGTLLWSHEQTNEWSVHPNTPVYTNGMLYCVSGYGRGGVMLQLAPDGKSVKELWRNTSLDNRMGGVVMKDGRIYGTGDKTRSLQCLDAQTGKLLYSMPNLAPGNIIFADGLLYVYAERGTVNLIEPLPDQFKLLSSFKVPYGTSQHWAHLVIVNKRLYVRHGNSLMVYNLAAN
ncbi:MAG: PQQ-binding-like beta-propeller repeat protein [Bacteroidales bacterium]